MSGKVLVDTNLWVYLYSESSSNKHQLVRGLVDQYFDQVLVSSQILGELYHVLTRKGFKTQAEAQEIIVELTTAFPVADITTLNVLQALNINIRYQYSYWDSLIIATALVNDCQTLYSEDMHHTQQIDDKVRIVNPFAAS